MCIDLYEINPFISQSITGWKWWVQHKKQASLLVIGVTGLAEPWHNLTSRCNKLQTLSPFHYEILRSETDWNTQLSELLFFLVEDTPLCLKYVNKSKLHTYSVENNVFIELVATSFGHHHHHQAKVTQNLKRLVICSAQKCQFEWDPIYINVNIC
jgi:hypothetical protein